MKLVNAILALLMCANAFAGTEGGNGGGGVTMNGRPMTFYSAGLITERDPSLESEIPGLQDIEKVVFNFHYLTREKLGKYMAALAPNSNRNYYRVLDQFFDDKTLARIEAEYKRSVNLPDDSQITLFAITDNQSRNTYLLPNFYKLSKIEQMAILFHEAHWLVNPKTNYDQIVSIEASMQRYLENPKDIGRIFRLVTNVGNDTDRFAAALALDKDSNALKGLVSSGTISIAKLLGEKTVACMRNTLTVACYDELRYNLTDLSMRYPNSQLLKYLVAKTAVENGIRFSTDTNANNLISGIQRVGSSAFNQALSEAGCREGLLRGSVSVDIDQQRNALNIEPGSLPSGCYYTRQESWYLFSN